jgi:hypothetical protein
MSLPMKLFLEQDAKSEIRLKPRTQVLVGEHNLILLVNIPYSYTPFRRTAAKRLRRLTDGTLGEGMRE